MDNDASMAAYGEYRFGAGRGYRHLLLVTVGTGIGGGIVSDGRLLRGANGFAAEIGHIIVEPGGRPAAAATAAAGSRSPPGGRSIVWAARRPREHEHSILRRLAGGDPAR